MRFTGAFHLSGAAITFTCELCHPVLLVQATERRQNLYSIGTGLLRLDLWMQSMGTSMVYGLPAWGDTPDDPHSAFTHLNNYPIDGGLVDGPVYTSIYKILSAYNCSMATNMHPIKVILQYIMTTMETTVLMSLPWTARLPWSICWLRNSQLQIPIDLVVLMALSFGEIQRKKKSPWYLLLMNLAKGYLRL